MTPDPFLCARRGCNAPATRVAAFVANSERLVTVGLCVDCRAALDEWGRFGMRPVIPAATGLKIVGEVN